MDAYIKKGLLLTIEGIDGSGKSSVARVLYETFSSLCTTVLTREPGGTSAGMSIRELVHYSPTPLCSQAEFLLFAADRAQHSNELIIPFLSRGYLVISDRMADSSIAYQGYGRGLDKEFIRMVNKWALQGVSPDLTIYLKIDYEGARARVEKRACKKTSLEQEQEAFFKRVIEGFDELFEDKPHVISIDASQDLDKVCQESCDAVRSFLIHKGFLV